MPFQNLLNIPYKFLGRDKNGTDCLGLVYMYFKSEGINIPDCDGLPMMQDRQPDYMERAISALSRICTRVNVPQKHDIILMSLPGGYVHLGVMVDDTYMLHVLKDRPSMLVPVRKYRMRIVGVFRPTCSKN